MNQNTKNENDFWDLFFQEEKKKKKKKENPFFLADIAYKYNANFDSDPNFNGIIEKKEKITKVDEMENENNIEIPQLEEMNKWNSESLKKKSKELLKKFEKTHDRKYFFKARMIDFVAKKKSTDPHYMVISKNCSIDKNKNKKKHSIFELNDMEPKRLSNLGSRHLRNFTSDESTKDFLISRAINNFCDFLSQ